MKFNWLIQYNLQIVGLNDLLWVSELKKDRHKTNISRTVVARDMRFPPVARGDLRMCFSPILYKLKCFQTQSFPRNIMCKNDLLVRWNFSCDMCPGERDVRCMLQDTTPIASFPHPDVEVIKSSIYFIIFKQTFLLCIQFPYIFSIFCRNNWV